MSSCLAGKQDIVRADWPSDGFELSSNDPCGARSVLVEDTLLSAPLIKAMHISGE